MPQMTEQDLRERLEAAEEELADAQRAAGVVELDGGDRDAAAQRVADARADIERVNSAIAELEDREDKRREVARLRVEARARLAALDYWVEYTRRAPAVLKLRAELAVAEERLMELGSLGGEVAGVLARGSAGNAIAWLSGEAAAGRLPGGRAALDAIPELAILQDFAAHAYSVPRRAQVGRLTVGQCEDMLPRLEELRAEAAAVTDADLLAAERERRGA